MRHSTELIRKDSSEDASGGGYETMIVAVMEIEYEDIQDVSVSERSE